jgi:hypothetical protein
MRNLATLLAQRWRKAKGINEIAAENFRHLSAVAPVPITEDLVSQWIEEEKAVVCFSAKKRL